MKFFISAGDPSGDIHAAKLMKSLKDILPDSEFIGIGGKYMIEQGLDSIVDIKRMSVVGFWEVAKNYKFLKSIFNNSVATLNEKNIDAFIPVDYPGFNLKLSKKAKELNIPVIYYIAPQLWAWGTNRAKHLSDSTDLLLTILPFEKDFFEKYGIRTEFVGHPLLDIPIFNDSFPKYDDRENLLALMPGSRKQEVQTHLPIYKSIVDKFLNQYPNYKIGISLPENLKYIDIKKYFPDIVNFESSHELMRTAKFGIIKTGTSNLEASLCGLPFLMLYKTSSFTYQLGKRLVNLPYLSLVNILADRLVIKEHIQKINPSKIATDIESVITDRSLYSGIQKQFEMIRTDLGEPGASNNAATEIKKFLKI